MNISQRVLITGAGFTKNFGGFLASEMWERIFNHPQVQENRNLREKFLKSYDYESIYDSLAYTLPMPEYKDEWQKEYEILTCVLKDVYKKLDKIIYQWRSNNNSPYPINHYALDTFLNKFSGNKTIGKGFIFTVNQDLFFERKYINGTSFIYPGIKYPYVLNEPLKRESPLSEQMYITIPDQVPEEQKRTELDRGNSFYIKLHGSFNWLGSDKKGLIITGQKKLNEIQGNSLLSWYWDIFQTVLNSREVKVLMLGYGLKDRHLNKVIEKAVFEKNLKLYIISPQSFSDVRKSAEEYNFNHVLEYGLKGYFQTDLLGLFPSDQSRTQLAEDLDEYFFKT